MSLFHCHHVRVCCCRSVYFLQSSKNMRSTPIPMCPLPYYRSIQRPVTPIGQNRRTPLSSARSRAHHCEAGRTGLLVVRRSRSSIKDSWRDNARILEELYPGEFGEPKNQRLRIEPNRRLSSKRPVLTYAENRFSKSVDDILSGTVPAAESMVDHVECVFH